MMALLDGLLGGLSGVPLLGAEINRVAIRHVASRTAPRPRAFSLWSHVPKPADAEGPVCDYTSWPGLTDRRFSGRHLPPSDAAYVAGLPPLDDVTALFKRAGAMRTDRSSMLLMFFAQWFTDSVLRVDSTDRRKNTSNHEIDLCQIYGLTEETARILRSGTDGKLRSQTINGESYLEYLFTEDANGALKVQPQFQGLPYAASVDRIFDGVPAARRRKVYATGLERGNSSVGYVALNTLFMREHNRICAQLKSNNPAWDDERLFQTARMINTVLLMKLVIEEYINHIAGSGIFKLDPTIAEQENWYRTNWIAIEFDMLYRWHSLVPDAMSIGGATVGSDEFRNNNALLEQHGLAAIVTGVSQQKAGRIGLFNTPAFLMPAEKNALKMGRDFRLSSYNDYRERFGLNRLADFSELTHDEGARQKLSTLYGSIDNVEFLVGIFAEDHGGESLFGSLLSVMVAYDAFTQIFTNPLLSRNVYNEHTFSAYGLKLIDETRSIHDLAARNVNGDVRASLKA
jgi:prostaglandin-endoperoxide synthase 2